MRLDPSRFNHFLGGDVRQDFVWRQRSACPCVSPDSGQARIGCPLCFGKGNIYGEGVRGFAGVTNQTPKAAIAIFGTWESGDCVLSIPESSPMYGARRYDRFTAVNSTTPFSEVIRPGLNDKIRGAIKSIDRVFWISPSSPTRLVEGVAPEIGDDGSMSWYSDGPPDGVFYTIEGVRQQEFYCFTPLASNRNSGVSGLPVKLAARVFDLMGR